MRLQRAIDRYVGNVLCEFAQRSSKPEPAQVRRVLVVKLWALGESVLTLPAIQCIRKRHPAAKLAVLCTPYNQAVFRGQPFIDEVLLFRLGRPPPQRQTFDVAYDMEPFLNLSALLARWAAGFTVGFGHGRRARLYDRVVPYNDQVHAVQTFLELLTPPGVAPQSLVALQFPQSAEQDIDRLLRDRGLTGGRLLGIMAGATNTSRSRVWPAERFAALADRCAEGLDMRTLLIGGSAERQLNAEICARSGHGIVDLAERISLPQLFCLLQRLNAFVSNDTGPMHMAAAMATPTIGLFGPNTPTRYAPYGPGNASIYHPIKAEPCINVHRGEFPDCLDHNHMEAISVDEVFADVARIARS